MIMIGFQELLGCAHCTSSNTFLATHFFLLISAHRKQVYYSTVSSEQFMSCHLNRKFSNFLPCLHNVWISVLSHICIQLNNCVGAVASYAVVLGINSIQFLHPCDIMQSCMQHTALASARAAHANIPCKDEARASRRALFLC